MKKITIICVGKLKSNFWKEAANHYIKLLSNWRRVEMREIRDGTGSCRIDKEAMEISRIIAPGQFCIAMTEKGKEFTSRQFAEFMGKTDENGSSPVFVIGGPFGLGQQIMERSNLQLSLSSMTWPHELARVLLLEQLYRVESILHSTPYHHD